MSGSCCLNRFYFEREPARYGDAWHLPAIPLLQLRGPFRDSKTVCIGGAATFGRFADLPYPEQIGATNLGIGAASPSTFLDPRLVAVINKASRVVLQLPTARSESTRHWQQQVNEAGLPSDIVQHADGRLLHCNEAWREAIESDADLIRRITEARRSWIANMQLLLELIDPPVTLLWFASRGPDYEMYDGTLHGIYNRYPHLVTRYMVNEVAQFAAAYHEVTWEGDADQYYPTAEAHIAAARSLA